MVVRMNEQTTILRHEVVTLTIPGAAKCVVIGGQWERRGRFIVARYTREQLELMNQFFKIEQPTIREYMAGKQNA